jgi:hypothetical protein
MAPMFTNGGDFLSCFRTRDNPRLIEQSHDMPFFEAPVFLLHETTKVFFQQQKMGEKL